MTCLRQGAEVAIEVMRVTTRGIRAPYRPLSNERGRRNRESEPGPDHR